MFQVAHELLALQLLTVLLEEPTDDSVEIAVNFTKEIGQVCRIFFAQVCTMFIGQVCTMFIGQVCRMFIGQVCTMFIGQACTIFIGQVLYDIPCIPNA